LYNLVGQTGSSVPVGRTRVKLLEKNPRPSHYRSDCGTGARFARLATLPREALREASPMCGARTARPSMGRKRHQRRVHEKNAVEVLRHADSDLRRYLANGWRCGKPLDEAVRTAEESRAKRLVEMLGEGTLQPKNAPGRSWADKFPRNFSQELRQAKISLELRREPHQFSLNSSRPADHKPNAKKP